MVNGEQCAMAAASWGIVDAKYVTAKINIGFYIALLLLSVLYAINLDLVMQSELTHTDLWEEVYH